MSVRKFCIYCGKAFDARRKDALYCSPNCREQSWTRAKGKVNGGANGGTSETKPAKSKSPKPETLDDAMEKCKNLGITYAEYQKRGMIY